jgi:hypothetical protein
VLSRLEDQAELGTFPEPAMRIYNRLRMPTLRSQLDALAARFAEQIVAALQGASLNELVGAKDDGHIGNGRSTSRPASKAPPAKAVLKPSGRLARRSPEEIEAMLAKVVLLVKTQKTGMRAEEIRSRLGMLPKEMPRILKEGLAKKKLTARGQKRSTTYFAK